jgi:alkanesulfonate monooxygenase SsuD/methylene tetrahydromethanopterin reductase-like flavin-dependent oxidoreductase (luciferase family)
LAAKHADTIVALVRGVEGMKEYRDDVSARMIANGRKPTDAKVLFLISPILGDTDDEAIERRDRIRARQMAEVEYSLSAMSYVSGIDFGKFDPDAPFPDLTGESNNGHQSMVADFQRHGQGKTLRQVAASRDIVESIELVGSPDSVAVQMGEAMEYAGGDGYLVASAVTRKNITDIADGLAPALRRRGLTRSSYSYEYFRDNLLEF